MNVTRNGQTYRRLTLGEMIELEDVVFNATSASVTGALAAAGASAEDKTTAMLEHAKTRGSIGALVDYIKTARGQKWVFDRVGAGGVDEMPLNARFILAAELCGLEPKTGEDDDDGFVDPQAGSAAPTSSTALP